MRIDPKLARLLSDFFLDIAKAFFVATFVTPSLTNNFSTLDVLFIISRGFTSAILFLILSWICAKLEQ